MAMITIGAVDLPDPAEYTVRRSDLDSENTGRSESGVLQRDRVRAGVYKISATFRVTRTNLKVVTDAIAPVSFSCTFFDPTTSSAPTKTMYAGDRSAVLRLNPSTGESYWELTVDLIEF
jgi:hypothetical protein